MGKFKPPTANRVHYTEYQKQVMAGLGSIIRQLDLLIGLESGLTDKREFKKNALLQRDAAMMQQLEEEQIQESIDAAAKRNEELLRTEEDDG